MSFRVVKQPRALRRSTVHLDNVALVPASLLPLKGKWQMIAKSLGHGETLIILPSQAKQQRVALSVVSRLREKGKRVQVMDKHLHRHVVGRTRAPMRLR